MNPLNVGREGGPPVGVQRTARISTGGVARPRHSPSGGGTARPGPASSMLTNNSVAKSQLVNGGPAAATANGKSSSTETKTCVCWDPVPIAMSGDDGDTDETGTRRPRSPEEISQLVQNLCYSMHLDTKQLLPTEYTEQDFCGRCFEWMDELLEQQKIITDAQGKISTIVKEFQHAVRDAQILNVGFESQPTTSSVAISEQQNLRNMILQGHRKYLLMEKQWRTNCLAPKTALLGLDQPQLNQMSISRDENIRNQFSAVGDGPSRSRSRSNNLETRQENPTLEVNNPGSSTSNSNEENLEESAHQDDLDDEEADLQSHRDDDQGNQSVNTHGDFLSDEFSNAYDEKSCSLVMKQETSSPSMEDDSVDNENESPESNAAVVATPRLTRVRTGSQKRKMFSQEKPKRGRSQQKKQRIIAPTSTPVEVQTFSCPTPTCMEQLENKKALQKHKKTHMFTTEECDICGLLLKCWGKTNMKAHKNRHMKKGEKKTAAAVIKKAKKSRGSYKKRVEKPKK